MALHKHACIQEYTKDTIGMSKVGHLLVIIGALEIYDRLDIYNSY